MLKQINDNLQQLNKMWQYATSRRDIAKAMDDSEWVSWDIAVRDIERDIARLRKQLDNLLRESD